MKIGILTLLPSFNYGGALQAWALCTYLKKLGYDCEVIPINRTYFRKNTLIHKRVLEPFEWLRKKIKFTYNMIKHKEIYHFLKGIILQDFLFSGGYKTKELKKRVYLYDTFIVGSDIVWGQGMKVVEGVFFLDFCKDANVKRIAYAPSMGGLSDLINDSPEMFKINLDHFHFISCREMNAVNYLNSFLDGKPCEHVVDPTLLLKANDYDVLLHQAKAREHKKPFVFVYDLWKDSELVEEACLFAAKNNFEIIMWSRKPKSCIGPCEFLWHIKNSKFVFTNSFHATIFAIQFKVPFLTKKSKKVSDRLDTLFSMIDLNERYVESFKNCESLLLEKIDFEAIESNITKYREKSINFLKRALA